MVASFASLALREPIPTLIERSSCCAYFDLVGLKHWQFGMSICLPVCHWAGCVLLTDCQTWRKRRIRYYCIVVFINIQGRTKLIRHYSMTLIVIAASIFSVSLFGRRLYAWNGVELEKLRSSGRLVHSVWLLLASNALSGHLQSAVSVWSFGIVEAGVAFSAVYGIRWRVVVRADVRIGDRNLDLGRWLMMHSLTIGGIEAWRKRRNSTLRKLLVVLTFEAVVPWMRWQPCGASLSSLANEPVVLGSQLFLQVELMA